MSQRVQRRHHYEQAFENYLRARRIPYVAVDEARKALLPGDRFPALRHDGHALKSFDVVIYGEGANLLVEVKGRRIMPRRSARASAGAARLENWVTLDDVESLSRWEMLFGPSFEGVFLFVYWCDELPPDALFDEIFEHAGRWYSLRCVRLADYKARMRVRSPRWRTVHLAPADFSTVGAPLAPIAPHALPAGRRVGRTLAGFLAESPPPLPALDQLLPAGPSEQPRGVRPS
ncbi:MAG: HYExAFE family protein [Planctomycetota bacterium]|nr:HYExAFE family protein [Planctomycetota bacterium]